MLGAGVTGGVILLTWMLGAGVTGGVIHLTWMLGAELRSSATAVHAVTTDQSLQSFSEILILTLHACLLQLAFLGSWGGGDQDVPKESCPLP